MEPRSTLLLLLCTPRRRLIITPVKRFSCVVLDKVNRSPEERKPFFVETAEPPDFHFCFEDLNPKWVIAGIKLDIMLVGENKKAGKGN